MSKFADRGVDSAAYSIELMELASQALQSGRSRSSLVSFVDGIDAVNPADCALQAMATAEQETTKYGASTMTVLHLEANEVGVASLGDSGFMLLRKAEDGMVIIARSSEQQHQWNMPFQLTRVPPSLKSRLPTNYRLDNAFDSELYNVVVRPGDLLLLYTDGFSDNLWERDILAVIGRMMGAAGSCLSPERVAKELVLAAQAKGADPRARVPFTEGAESHGYKHRGGKDDDITVVAGWVVPDGA
jgi:hypothetical protein